MLVRMIVDLQGYSVRSDGTLFEYPRRGHEIDLDDHTARELIHQGAAIPVVRRSFEAAVPRDTGEEQRGMATAAKLFERPTPPPTILDEVRSDAPDVEVRADVAQDTTQEDDLKEVLGPVSVAAPPPPAKRGPGRPRKYPRPGE